MSVEALNNLYFKRRQYKAQSFLITYQPKLNNLNEQNTIKVFKDTINKHDLEREFQKELQESIPPRAKGALKKFLEIFPDKLPVEFSFRKDNPRVSYLIADHIPDADPLRYDNHLYIHPISLLTMNSWIFINSYVENHLKAHNIPYKLLPINSLASKNVWRYGRNFLTFTGDWDIDWLAKPLNKRRFFTDTDTYLKFFLRENMVKDRNHQKSYDDLYRDAQRLAHQIYYNKDTNALKDIGHDIKVDINGQNEDLEDLANRIFVLLKNNYRTLHKV